MSKQLRKNILAYFRAISRAQEEIQAAQNDLAVHPRFNVVEIYRHLSLNEPLTLNRFVLHLKKKLMIQDEESIKAYIIKHNFEQIIPLQTFIQSILPFTPNILRECSENLVIQISYKELANIAMHLYEKVVILEISRIEMLLRMYRSLGVNWNQLRAFLEAEIAERTNRNEIAREPAIYVIRVWMEIHSGFEEYQSLNIVRWFGGIQDQQVKRGLTFKKKHEEQGRLIFSRSKSQKKISKNNSVTKNIIEFEAIFNAFAKYVRTIIYGRRKVHKLTDKLKLCKKEVQKAIAGLINKQKSISAQVLIKFIQIGVPIERGLADSLRDELQSVVIDPHEIEQILLPMNNDPKSDRQPAGDILQTICEILLTTCSSKVIVKELSKQLFKKHKELFGFLDKREENELDHNDFSRILRSMEIDYKEPDLIFIMKSFGNGRTVTPKSFGTALNAQLRNQQLKIF